jgi:predicted DCC family thiol-disulfide oxidoreductase YuxK
MTERIPSLTLYGTTGCHLCDEAEVLLKKAAAARRLEWQYVDIALDEALVEQYGMRIPVLRTAAGRELGWPFSLLDILALV